MRINLRPSGKSPPQLQQRGMVALMGAIWMMVALIVLMGLDIGNLFWQKRELQKIADMAALAGAQGVSAGCATVQSYAQSNAQLNGLRLSGVNADTLSPADCGNWNPKLPPVVEPGVACNPACYFQTNRTPLNAARVTVSRMVPYFFVFNWGSDGRLVNATATATSASTRARLQIRNTLVSVNTEKSDLLNAVVGGMLGGNLALDAVGWNGLVNNNINLLDYLDQLAVNLDIEAGKYDQVLGTNADVGQLLKAAIDVMERAGSTAAVAASALNAIKLTAQAGAANPLLKLGDILGVATGTPAEGLRIDLQAFQLVQGIVQLANGQNAAVASIPLLSVPGLVDSNVRLQVIEPPQLSAIGDPALAKADPLGTNRIYVRTAQIRTMASLDLSGVAGKISDIGNAVFSAISPLTSAVNSVLNLQLKSAVEQLLGAAACPIPILLPSCPEYEEMYAQALPARVDISLEVGNAEAYVTDYNCNSSESKSLTVQARAPMADVRVGQIGNAFLSKTPPTVSPVALVELGYTTAKPDVCLLAVLCSGWKWKQPNGTWGAKATAAKNIIAGVGAQVGSSQGTVGQGHSLLYSTPPADNLPDITAPFSNNDSSFKKLSVTDLIAQIGSTVGNVNINVYRSNSTDLLGALLAGTLDTVNALVSTLQNAIKGVLAPLLDPLLTKLLQTLGIDLNEAAVGARLSCQQGAELVY